jgi:hypothetical protein
MIDKSLMYGEEGKLLTQSLFLELGYTENAQYTLKEQDFEYKGRVYPAIKRLYLEIADPTEYEFAKACFLGWKHWQRIADNKAVYKYIQEWREELEWKLRSEAVSKMATSASTGNYQAAKWFADRGWIDRGAGRPTKKEIDQEKAFQARAKDEYGADVLRMFKD